MQPLNESLQIVGYQKSIVAASSLAAEYEAGVGTNHVMGTMCVVP